MKFTWALLLCSTLLPLVSVAQTQPGRFFKIPANTIIRVRTVDEVSSETARVGDVVPMEVLADVLVNGSVVVRQGATAVGQISRVKEARTIGRRGNVALTLSYVEAVTGEHILVGGNRAEKGNGKAAKLTAEIAVTTAVTGGLIGALWLFEKGHDVSIPPGTAFSVYTVGDTTIDLSLLAPGTMRQAAPIQTFLADASTATQGEIPISADQAINAMPKPRSNSLMSFPLLGVVAQTNMNVGAEVVSLTKGSAAEQVGLQVGNVIAEVDGKRIMSVRDLATALGDRAPDSEVRVSWLFRSNHGWISVPERVMVLSGGRSVLGISGANWELGSVKGVEILGVDEDSPAKVAGLRMHEVITAVDGLRVHSTNDLAGVLAQHAPGSQITLGCIFKGNIGWMNVEVLVVLAGR